MKILNGKNKTEALARPHADIELYGVEKYAIGWRLAASYQQGEADTQQKSCKLPTHGQSQKFATHLLWLTHK